VQNFFLNEVRVTELGTFMKRRELQYRKAGKWHSVFASAAQ
jgi:hypothetical protein